MESISQIIKAQQPAGSNELALPGTQQLSRDSVIQLGAMLRQMSAAFPHQEYDAETTRIFLLTFEDLATEYGMKNLETALRSFLTRQKFFPHPSEVREVLDEMAKKKKQQATAALPKLGCPKCHDGGFTDGYILQVIDGVRYAKECDCLLERRRAKKAMEAA